MEWMTTRREESGLLCFLFCVTVFCPGLLLLLLLSLSLLLLLLLASSGLLTATDLSMFERVSAVMVHTCHLTYLSITLPPLEDTYISSKSDIHDVPV